MAKLELQDVDARLREQYAGRVERVGAYWTRQGDIVCWCHSCRETFRQKAESLFRGYRTRCKCNYEVRSERSRGYGHKVVNKWELTADDLVRLPSGRPGDDLTRSE